MQAQGKSLENQFYSEVLAQFIGLSEQATPCGSRGTQMRSY